MLHYFAYGSNLHPKRLLERIPSARLIGKTTLSRHRLTFHKKSNDGSGKCNIFVTGDAADEVHGAIYEIALEQKSELDRIEGKGAGYSENYVTLSCHGEEYRCFTYIAQETHIVDDLQPYHWYKELVLLGARYLTFPDEYISLIHAIESVEDLDSRRKSKHKALLDRMRTYR